MTQYDSAVVGGTVVRTQGCARINIGISDGRIAYLGSKIPEARETIDASGLIVLPAGVDAHVHFMEPGAEEREDYERGSAAAARAGVTTVVEHTHAWPIRNCADLETKKSLINGKSRIDYGFGAHAWPGMADQVAPLWDAGIAFFKVFTCTTHGIIGHDSARLRQHLEANSDVNALSLIHCEEESLCALAEEELKEAGRDDHAVVYEWRNRDAELVAAAATALLVRRYNARANIAHVSNPEVASYINRERASGADIWAEACPQYFLLREDQVLDEGPLRKFTPPARVRTEVEEAQMWRLLRDGVLNFVSSDHAPSTQPQKHAGDIWNVPFGLPGLDTTFPALIDAVHRQLLSWPDVARVYAENPARRYGFWGRKGAIRLGFQADLALVDPQTEWVLSDSDIESKAQWSPYSGRTFHGRNVRTVFAGQTLFELDHGVRDIFNGSFIPGAGYKGGAR